MKLSTSEIDTPIGPLYAAVDDDGALVNLRFLDGTSAGEIDATLEKQGYAPVPNKSACRQVAKELREYFRGKREEFELVVKPPGTDFQKKVWRQLARVPYGETVSYAWLAKKARNPQAVRAVGRCNALNPIVVVLPCHRVVGSDGSLTGYGGGLDRKRHLLELEGALAT